MPDMSDITTWMADAKQRQFRSEIPKKLIPQTHRGDMLISTTRFVLRHRRFPTKRNLWNNFVHRHKASGVLSSALCQRVTDKEHVKTYLKEKLGKDVTVPTLGIVERPEDLATYVFPQDCCVKPTHSCGRVMFCRGGAGLDYPTLVGWFFHNYYLRGREANYRYLTPKLIVEPILYDGKPFTEYRFYCVNGKVRGIWVETDRFKNTRSALYDFDFKEVYRWKGAGDSTRTDSRPDTLDAMIAAAATVASDFSFIRVDMFSDGQTFYIGELTNCDGNALGKFPQFEDEALTALHVFGGEPDPILTRPR